MSKENSVIIKIDGDASDFKKTLENIGDVAKAGMADVKAGIDMATAAMQKLASVAQKGIDYNATIEQMQTSFEVMTGSAEKAAEVVERLRVMGAETPFETTDLVNITQLLMQYGFTADDAIEKMSMLGDIAQGNKEAMNSIALGYAQMSSAGKVNLQDIKQMINGGFNPLQEISERTGESMASLYDRISKGTMTIDEITQSMVHATSEGGKFYQSMEKQSQTLSGQLATLKDNTDSLLGSLTEGFSEDLRDNLLPLANNMVEELQEAFSARGTQGLLDAASEMIPNLVTMLTGGFEDGIAAVGKWLPKGVQGLMKALPESIRGSGKITSEITNVLFELAGGIISDLIPMLPELVPALLGGIANVGLSVLNGAEEIIAGVISGTVKAAHKGQTAIAGVWVDETELSKYTFKIDADVTPAQKSIESAYTSVRETLGSDLLTDEQRDAIIDIIDSDYEAIKAKLISFGWGETEAGDFAEKITQVNKDLQKGFSEIDVGADTTTLAKWAIQANGSRVKLRSRLEEAGLTPEDQQAVIDTFNTMTGNITGSLPNVVDEIYATLTDGKAENDDEKSLKEKLDEAYAADLEEVDAWLEENIGELDENSTTYAADVAALQEQAASYKAEIGTLYNEMTVLTETLAGKPTAAVQEQMQAFADIEARLNAIQQKINETNEAARAAEENAFQVVRAGANTDEETISTAISYKVSQFKIDEQTAEDAYAEAITALNEKLANKEIATDEYNTQKADLDAQLEAEKAAAKQTFNTAFAEIMRGIAESEGNGEAFNEMLRMMGAEASVDSFFEGMFDENGQIDQTKLDKVKENLAALLGEAFNPEQVDELARRSDENASIYLNDYLRMALANATVELDDTQKEVLSGKIGAAWGAALEQGILSGTDFDTKDTDEQLSALLAGAFDSATIDATPGITGSGEKLGEASTEKMADYDGAKAAGAETVRGLEYSLSKGEDMAYKKGLAMGSAVAKGYEVGQDIHSPSRVMRDLGNQSGKGLEIGLQESMARAAMTAKMMAGQIATAADFSAAVRVANMPNLQQEIISANEQNNTPVYLDGQQIAEIQGFNNSTVLAWKNAKAAKGVGGK